MKSIKELKKEGYRTFVKHDRGYRHVKSVKMDGGSKKKVIKEKGGTTVVALIDPKGLLHVGVAHCNVADNYNKKLGVQIALTRALKNVKV